MFKMHFPPPDRSRQEAIIKRIREKTKKDAAKNNNKTKGGKNGT